MNRNKSGDRIWVNEQLQDNCMGVGHYSGGDARKQGQRRTTCRSGVMAGDGREGMGAKGEEGHRRE
eukprot:9868329-Alexandrium_andersonii.AAC.1